MSVTNLNGKKLKIGIIGAGPAGGLAAYLFAKSGHSVQLFERKINIQRKVCGEYLCPKGVELLEKLKLVDSLTSDFLPLYGMILASSEDDVIPSYFPQTQKKEQGLSLNRALFDQRIVELAKSTGAEIFFDKAIINAAFDSQSKQWMIRTEEESFNFDLLIAADGRQSKIGHLLGHSKKINTDRIALHCYLPRKTERNLRMGEMHILKNGSYCGLDPITSETVNFSIVCDSNSLKILTPEEIINNAIENSSRLGKMFDSVTSEDEIRIVTTLKNENSFVAGNQLAYIGDAAGFIDPLTGEGIYNALLSAHLLHESISSSGEINSALLSYKKKKRILSFQKNLINHFFQFLIRQPLLIRLTVKFLNKSPERASHFIGIVGNIHTPFVGIIKMLKA